MSWIVGTWVLRALLAIAFIGMGVLHFLPSTAKGMRAAIPPSLRLRPLPSPAALVAFTGVCEFAGAVGLLVPSTRAAAGVALSVFLVCVFPANAYMAGKREQFGRAAVAFWPRLAGQLVLIVFVLVAGFGPA